MRVTYKMLPDGGFVAGDLNSRMTAYAAPISLFAYRAKQDPLRAAEMLLDYERAVRFEEPLSPENDYDRRNWMQLDGMEVPEEVEP